MEFLVFRCKSDRNCFIDTSETRKASFSEDVCPSHGDTLERASWFPETGQEGTAFDEGPAERSIEENGFYRMHSETFDPVAQPPLLMP